MGGKFCCFSSEKKPLLPKNKTPTKHNNPSTYSESNQGEEVITLTGRCEYCNKIFQKTFEGKWRGNYAGDLFCTKDCSNKYKAKVYSVSV